MVTTVLVVVPVAVLLALALDCWRWGITPTPSLGEARRVCLQLMAEQPPGGTVAELGSGAGGMARAMAQRLPQATIWAMEGSWWLWALGRLQAALVGKRNMRWHRGDFFAADLRACSGVFCYLYPGAMTRLSGKLRAELAPGSWVVSHAFALPNWQPEQVICCTDLWRTRVYLYRVPLTGTP